MPIASASSESLIPRRTSIKSRLTFIGMVPSNRQCLLALEPVQFSLFALALLSKPTAVTLPVVLVVVDAGGALATE